MWHILEGDFELVLANAMHVKNVPGRKTDVNDATWIADLLAHGLIRGPTAMFVDPTGKGWTFKRGEHLGLGARVVGANGEAGAYPLFWKVDRIKDDVVWMRDDAMHPEAPTVYREVALHAGAEKG